MKLLKQFLFGLVACLVVLIGYLAATNYLNSEAQGAPGCHGTGVHHQVIIQNSVVAPDRTSANLCDSLTIINQDPTMRLIAFGPHDHHTPYDGVTERYLGAGQSLTVSLDQAGTFSFHDHIHDTVTGTFTVTKP